MNKIRNASDEEIAKLNDLRKILVKKNLEGIYSDEIFKEQSALIANRMLKAQIAKEDSLFDKYNIDKVTSFIKTLLADLGETYKRSTLSQIKVLLGSMYPSGLAWRYDGTLNHQISPIYQAIVGFDKGTVLSSAEERS